MTKIIDTATAILKFEEAATKHAEATEQGDYKTANKNYAIIVKVVTFLKEHDEIQKLSELLSHSSDGVKGWAATYLLPLKEREAMKALGEIAKGSGIHSLTAETTISEWEKGNLKL
jgi:hypothetical protein